MSIAVAIIGQSFRFPGTRPAHYWEALLAGRDLVGAIDASRFPPESFLHPDPRHAGTSYSFAAGVIDHVGDFDAGFFGISPREAALIDPQQRLLLELGWEALENAGVPPRSLRGTDAGVFVGISSADYSYRLMDDFAALDAPAATGNAGSIAANRLSWFFDLRGPSMAIDTACSSSMVAFHQACRAIQNGDSSLALAGGVSLLMHPYVFVSFAKASMLSRQGRCRVFDASADGYVRAEGGGVLVLKNLEQALADGNRILAVVAGSGVNADGHTQGLTVPSAAAQAALLSRVYSEAGITPDELDYVEAHGTGTVVGDPIETRAISMALASHRPATRPLPIGSVKSNMGHLEAASGIAGLVKAVHCLTHRVVPATIGVESINPSIPVGDWNLDIVTHNRPLSATGRLVVGVNSFGFGGANAHVVLTSFEDKKPALPAAVSVQSLPVLLSAHDEAALRASAAQMAEVLERPAAPKLQDVAYELNHRRDWLGQRLLVQGTASQVARALRSYGEGQGTEFDLATGVALPAPVKLAFVYSGNGAQWEGMGRRLLATSPSFRQSIDEVDTLFRAQAGFSILDELLGLPGEHRYAATEVAQPVLFALQVGITRLLRAQGLSPAAVLGHSVGEIAAAWAAGALSLEAAVDVIYQRSRLQGTTRGTGAMTAVGLSAQVAQELVDHLAAGEALCIAAVNSSNDCTLAGVPSALDRIEAALAEMGVFYRRLALDYAFHSPLMDGIEKELRQVLSGLAPAATAVPFYSSVSGGLLAGQALNASYWWQNIREPVAFESAARAAQAAGANVLLEIGPHPILAPYLRRAAEHQSGDCLVLPTLTRQDDSAAAVWQAGARAVIAGAPPDWTAFFPRPRPPLTLPHYPWQRKRYWHPVTNANLGLLARHHVHPLLGYALPQHEGQWENTLDTRRLPALAEHAVGETSVLPAAGFVELALAVARERQRGDWLRVLALDIRAPLVLDESSSRVLRTGLTAPERVLRVQSRIELASDWVMHCAAELPEMGEPPAALPAALELPTRPADFDATGHYAQTTSRNLRYGPSFQRVVQGWREADTVIATVRAENTDTDYQLAPMVLDAAFQLIVQLAETSAEPASNPTYLPVGIGRLLCRRASGSVQAIRARLVHRTSRTLRASFELFDAEGQLLALVDEADFRRVPMVETRPPRQLAWRWQTLPARHPVVAAAWLDHALESRLAQLANELRQAGLRTGYVEELEPLLDSLCGAYLHRALLGLADANGLLKTEDAPRACASLWAALIGDAEMDGVLTPVADGWQLLPPEMPLTESIDALIATLLAEHPAYFELVLQVVRTGLALPALLTGETDFARLHPRGLSRPSLQERVRGVTLGARLGVALNPLRFSPPDAAPLRVMEIGERLPLWLTEAGEVAPSERGQYRFASVSARRVEQAASRWPWLHTLTIDTAGAPLATHDCDVVMLRDDAASRTDSSAMLAQARASLAPGGSLLVLGQHPARWLEWIFGADEASRNTGAGSRQQSITAWQQTLASLGFDKCRVVALESEAAGGTWALLAKAPAAPPALPAAQATDQRWLLVVDKPSQALGTALGARLQARGAAVIELSDLSPETLATRLAAHEDLTGAVLLAGLPDLKAALSPAAVLAAQTARCALASALVQALDAANTKAACWLLTRNAFGEHGLAVADAALWGFGRTLMNEADQTDVRLLDLANLTDTAAAAALADELLAPEAENELCLAPDGSRRAPRLGLSAPAQRGPNDTETTALVSTQPGSLEHLAWRRQALATVGEDEVEVQVAASALNFRDMMLAIGLLPPETVDQGLAGPNLGLEFAGTVVRVGRTATSVRVGDRVMGYGPSSFANRVVTKHWALIAIPSDLPFAAAATIPTAFVTAWYSLVHLAQLKAGEKVLIHAAAGGLGLAAIQVAHWLGAEVYATAGADEKRDFLRMLGVTRIYDSRSLRFADEIQHDTAGQGMDVVLNSLSGEAIARSLDVLKPFGRFIELGKRDFFENTRVGLRPFRNNLSYFGVDVDQLMRVQPRVAKQVLDEVTARFTDGSFLPLPYREFSAHQVLDAFRQMQSAQHIGKLVVSYPRGVPTAPVEDLTAVILRADASYLVTGGMSGFGLAIAAWLAAQGAKDLVLVSRSGEMSEDAAALLAPWVAKGLRVQAAACDVTDEAALEQLFAEAEARSKPISGLIHAAAHYDDGLARQQSEAQLSAVMAPKLVGALNLHRATAGRPLDFFVMVSSATTLFGNPGQSAYVAANHALESLVHARRKAGLPASVICLGPIEDTGYLARHQTVKTALTARLGGQALSAAEALRGLAATLVSSAPYLALLRYHWGSLARLLHSAGAPKFAELATAEGTQTMTAPSPDDARRQLLEMPEAELRVSVLASLKRALGNVLNVEAEEIDTSAPVYSLGLDSLMGVELAMSIETSFGVRLPEMGLGEQSLTQLTMRIIDALRRMAETDGEAADESDLQDTSLAFLSKYEAQPLAARALKA